MLNRVENRELFSLKNATPTVRGTYHRPHVNSSPQSSDCPQYAPIGVLLLNGLYVNRSSNGDAAVYWADYLSRLGFPTFRIDLPGMGDADGEPPDHWLDYINRGEYASTVTTCMDEIIQRFGVAQIVIAGHCSGAVTAMYAAAASKQCCGVVVLDPYFHLPRLELPKFRQELNLWSRQNWIGGMLSHVFDLIKQCRLVFRQNDLPSNANVALLQAWEKVLLAGVPVLVLKSPSHRTSGVKARVGEFDYFRYITSLAGSLSRLTIKIANGANHSFSNRHGRVAVQQTIGTWLNDNFPRDNVEVNSVVLRSPTKNLEAESKCYMA